MVTQVAKLKGQRCAQTMVFVVVWEANRWLGRHLLGHCNRAGNASYVYIFAVPLRAALHHDFPQPLSLLP